MATSDKIPDDIADVSMTPQKPETASEQISMFVSDVSELARLELSYLKTRFAYSQSMAKRAGFFALVSIATFFAAIAALIFGSLLIVAYYAGPIVATILVTAIFLSITFITGMLARKSAKKLSFLNEEVSENEQS
jgi:Putative Actinobacterial Holin-X, holin superfamily III